MLVVRHPAGDQPEGDQPENWRVPRRLLVRGPWYAVRTAVCYVVLAMSSLREGLRCCHEGESTFASLGSVLVLVGDDGGSIRTRGHLFLVHGCPYSPSDGTSDTQLALWRKLYETSQDPVALTLVLRARFRGVGFPAEVQSSGNMSCCQVADGLLSVASDFGFFISRLFL